MKVVFTKNSTFMSKLICWAFKEPVSHSAIIFDDMLVTHSSLFGVTLEWFPSFIKRYEIVLSVNFDLPLEKEEEVYRSMLNSYAGTTYDYKSFFFFAWCAFLFRFFGRKLPERNAFNDEEKFLCTEWVLQLPDWVIPDKKTLLNQVVTPHQLYKALNRQLPEHGE